MFLSLGTKLITQLAMSWRHDGQHLAAGLHNKSLMTFATSQLL